ncbi:hypothetical protein BCR39DRAFT_556454 [Naematelia encephala]|uniref:BTB domain-containing protein n=1 Tax=Naematelia encephala TaxID=71784 RepID=A0A1Y2BJL5_9TREE|nr:hypothetical protein BCR39DRAFT_556454 [Naematelia encephala]
MSEITATRDKTSNFGFSVSTGENDVVLISNDDVAFHFDLCLLTHFSPFFKDAATIPSSTPDMEFPETSSTTLALALGYLRSIPLGLDFDLPSYSDVDVIFPLVDFANIYDIAAIRYWVAKGFVHPQDSNPFVAFAVGVLTNNRGIVDKAAFGTTKLEITDMPSWVAKRLRERSPLVLLWLYEFHAAEKKTRHKFFNDLIDGKPILESFYGSGGKCDMWIKSKSKSLGAAGIMIKGVFEQASVGIPLPLSTILRQRGLKEVHCFKCREKWEANILKRLLEDEAQCQWPIPDKILMSSAR